MTTGLSRVAKYIIETANLKSVAMAEQSRSIPINIILGTSKTDKVAMMALTALGLAIRTLKGSINIYLPLAEVPPLRWQTASLKDILINEAARAGALDRLCFCNGQPDNSPTISLGCNIGGAYLADCAGWRAFIGNVAPPSASEIPAVAPAAAFATACTFARMFNAVVLNEKRYDKASWQYSLYNFDISSADEDYSEEIDIAIGKVSLLGAGAIGSGFAFTLWLSNWTGDFVIIDKDRYEEPNFETTMLISKSDELGMRSKAECLSSYLQNKNGLVTDHIKENITEDSMVLKIERNVFVCAVDNNETRCVLDAANADYILNGGIGGRKEDAGHVLFSLHDPDGPLLSTRYRQKEELPNNTSIPIEFDHECSIIPYQNTSMAAPFLGVVSGALLLAGCAHWSRGTKPDTNYIKFDLLKHQHILQRENKRRE